MAPTWFKIDLKFTKQNDSVSSWAAARQLPDSCQAAVNQLPGSCQEAFRQLPGRPQTIAISCQTAARNLSKALQTFQFFHALSVPMLDQVCHPFWCVPVIFWGLCWLMLALCWLMLGSCWLMLALCWVKLAHVASSWLQVGLKMPKMGPKRLQEPPK